MLETVICIDIHDEQQHLLKYWQPFGDMSFMERWPSG